MLLNIHKKIGF